MREHEGGSTLVGVLFRREGRLWRMVCGGLFQGELAGGRNILVVDEDEVNLGATTKLLDSQPKFHSALKWLLHHVAKGAYSVES